MWSIAPFFVVLLAVGSMDAAPNPASYDFGHNPYGDIETLMGRKPVGMFHLEGYGVAKRLSLPSESKYETKTEKQRRGPLNGLIPGGAFGRAARSNCMRPNCRSITYDKFIKLLRAPLEEKFHSYFPFENRNDSSEEMKDGQENMPISVDTYTPYQYKQLMGMK